MKSDFEIRQIGVENGEAFARIACAGFDLGEDAVPWLARLPSAENWHALMCFSEGRPAAAGALYAEGGAGWLDFASTDSEFRCRGAQTALLSARLNLANQLGCQKVYTCTGVDVEGDPQHSYNNILRAGFQMDYVRDNYAPITA